MLGLGAQEVLLLLVIGGIPAVVFLLLFLRAKKTRQKSKDEEGW